METAPANVERHKQLDHRQEAELVAAVLRKDRKATAEFVSRFADSVYAYVKWRLAPDIEPVDDIVQDVFLEAWRALAACRAESGIKPWMLGIARHKVQDHYRQRLRSFLSAGEPPAEPAVEPQMEEGMMERQRVERIEEILAELPEPYRVALRWRYWEEQSAAEMARLTGRTEKAVERVLARARAQFRAKYGSGTQ